jgi:hypothetical protein
MGGKNELFANPPAIHRYLWGDLYIAHQRGPASGHEGHPNSAWEAEVGVSRVKQYGDWTFKFWGIDFDDKVREAMKTGGMEGVNNLPEIRVGALMDITYKGQTTKVKPEIVMRRNGMETVVARIPGTENGIISFDKFNPPQGAQLSTTNLPDPTEWLLIDLSTKPMIWLVWAGTLLYTLGGLIAWRRRALEVGLIGPDDEPAGDSGSNAPDGGSSGQGPWWRQPNAKQIKFMNRASSGKGGAKLGGTGKQGAAPQPARATATPRHQ